VALAARPDLIERFRDVLEGQAEIVLGKTPPRHLDLRISPVRDRRGRFTGRLVILRDITERKLAEETLRQQQEADRHFSGQLAVLHEVSLELSLADSFDDLCRLAIELGRGRLGFDRIGIWFLDRDDPRYMVGTFGVDEQGRLRDERSQHLSLRPEWVWAELLGGGAPLIYRPTSEIYDDRGQTVGQGEMAAAAIWDGERVIGLVCIDNFLTGQPITERQQELLVLYARILGHLSTLKRTKGALQLSNAELQARNEELNAFAHTVAHDLKTPLNVILGYAELLTEGAGGSSADEIRLYAHAIRQGTHKATAIINSLLLLASARQQSVPVVPLDVGDLAAEACARLTQEIAGRRAEIVWPAAWLPALGYAPWIEEVWLNYLSNALKYGGRPELTPPVPPRIELSAQAGADGFIRFAVRDNGRGISAEDQKRLFVPFNRIGERREAGHGLGLSIVRRIVERLGGQVGVESVPGEGSTFYFTLPAVPGANGS
jgi:signal transduction histidine kinase